ncbi:hypothetical protein SS50377_25632 [Spironucleus salmonicida]|uniref:Uncharacterized protein n=1 Tax=Spironucleus salmonicida TaxID=348837 RepID=V6LYW7_9EUKA|nr:hypothetical protein SS50377_25632 [Spironucleus salmonicida]|eukprot:EST49468.1 Hypothetical protein SS50377_10217 [Spironucleus salmonicida]
MTLKNKPNFYPKQHQQVTQSQTIFGPITINSLNNNSRSLTQLFHGIDSVTNCNVGNIKKQRISPTTKKGCFNQINLAGMKQKEQLQLDQVTNHRIVNNALLSDCNIIEKLRGSQKCHQPAKTYLDDNLQMFNYQMDLLPQTTRKGKSEKNQSKKILANIFGDYASEDDIFLLE